MANTISDETLAIMLGAASEALTIKRSNGADLTEQYIASVSLLAEMAPLEVMHSLLCEIVIRRSEDNGVTAGAVPS